MCSDKTRRLRDVAGAKGVDREGTVGVALTRVDRCPSGRMNNHLRLDRPNRREHGVTVADVEVGLFWGDDVENRSAKGTLGLAGQLGKYLGPDLTCNSCQEHTHAGRFQAGRVIAGMSAQLASTTGERPMRGSHQEGLSRYHPTVELRPASKPTVGSQPSSVRILVESRR